MCIRHSAVAMELSSSLVCASLLVATPNSVTASQWVAYDSSVSRSILNLSLGWPICLRGLVDHCMPQVLLESALYEYGCTMG